mgnify:FL=1
MNLFNLTPIRPLDGGRITQIISDRFMYVGALVLAGFAVLMSSPILWLGWVLFLGSAKIETRLKVCFGIIVEALMLLHFLVLLHFGRLGANEGFWLMCLIFATITNLMRYRRYAFLKYMLKHKEELSEGSFKRYEYETALAQITQELPVASARVRIKWFLLYAGLFIFTALLMAIQIVAMAQSALASPGA